LLPVAKHGPVLGDQDRNYRNEKGRKEEGEISPLHAEGRWE